ncbi:MAG: hypothetical protein HQK65_13675 [Desulfamplus sp.]|nr:hypothetical protein [Desulfamplus sp.]
MSAIMAIIWCDKLNRSVEMLGIIPSNKIVHPCLCMLNTRRIIRSVLEAPLPDLVYGQEVNDNKGGRIVKITYRVKCGDERLKKMWLKISTTLL